MERKVIIISGPTASGKTELSISLAGKLNTEIISADSRQFYKYLDIGTAKPSSEQLHKIKHHLVSFLYPDQEYNVSLFRRDALVICEKLWAQNKLPIVTGGSGLYIKALTDGFSETPDPDPEIRENLLSEMSFYGQQYLYNKLLSVDPQSASKMLPQNWKRVIRALEVFYLTGKPIWQFHEEPNAEEPLNSSHYLLDWDRSLLYERINKRVDAMLSDGLVNEVKKILQMGYQKDLNSLNAVGYKEIISHIEGKLSLDEVVSLIKRNTRRYAKRQLTWFRKNRNIEWISIKSNEDLYIFAEKIADSFVSE